MIDPQEVCLISPLEQNKDVLAWDDKLHRRYFEFEAVQMAAQWRKNGGWLKDIDIMFFNVNNAKISEDTIKKLEDLKCKVIDRPECSYSDHEYQELGFLTEPLCGRLAEKLVDPSKKIFIKMDLDMKLLQPLDHELVEEAFDGVVIEQYTDYDKKGQRISIGEFNPFDTCFVISSRESRFYETYWQLCHSEEILGSEEWHQVKAETGDYFLEEFVVDFMFKNSSRFQKIIPVQGHLFGEGYKPVDLMKDDEIQKIRFLHSHIYHGDLPPNDGYSEQEEYKKYAERLSRLKIREKLKELSQKSQCKNCPKAALSALDQVQPKKQLVKQFVEQDSIPLNILAYTVDRCNFKCEYCYNRKPRKNIEIDINALASFIKSVREQTPASRKINISLIGGEPTLHSRALELCQILLQLENTNVELLTNFSQPAEYYLPLLESGVCIAASWHSRADDKRNWDYVEKMKKIPMKYFTRNQIEVRIMMENDNWDNSKAVFYALYPQFKKYVEISLLTRDDGTSYEYTDKQLSEYNQLIVLTKYKRDFFTLEYNDGTKKQVSFEDIYLNPRVNFHLWKCNAGQDYIYIHVDGTVYNCQSYYEHNRKPICNIFQTEFKYQKELFKPTICSVEYCSCDFDVYKEKILKGVK